VIWGGAPAQAAVLETINTGGGANVIRDLGMPLELLGRQRNDPLLSCEFGLTLALDSQTPIECPTIQRTGTSGALESLGGITITCDSLLSIAFSAAVLRDWGAGAQRSIYRRFSRSGIAGRARRLFLGLGTPGTLVFETGAKLYRDQNAPTEMLTIARADSSVPAEALGAAMTSIIGDAMFRIEGSTGQHVDWGVLGEVLGAAAVSAFSDSISPIETLGALSQDFTALVEALATGTTTIADAMLTIELGGASSVGLFSLESGSGKTRLLATPGRVRLLRRT
jgi:hypothetical protein